MLRKILRISSEKIGGETQGQTFVEYTIVIGMIIVIVFAMGPMIKRATQGMIKLTADQIGIQKAGDQSGFYNTVTGGYLEDQYAKSRAVTHKDTSEFFGAASYSYAEQVDYQMQQHSNLGFSLKLADYM